MCPRARWAQAPRQHEKRLGLRIVALSASGASSPALIRAMEVFSKTTTGWLGHPAGSRNLIASAQRMGSTSPHDSGKSLFWERLLRHMQEGKIRR